MDRIISNSFEIMCKNYEHLLGSFYPARGSTGFTEQNQVHNFINALKVSLDDADTIYWLEFPWASKSHHIDGMVFSPKYKSIFYIEAKRFSISKKKASIMRDIKRIIKENRTFINEYEINAKHEYMIALSDVWLEGSWKITIPSWWIGSDKLSPQLLPWEKTSHKSFSVPKKYMVEELKEIDVDWSGSNANVYWLGEKVPRAKNYCLLIASKKI